MTIIPQAMLSQRIEAHCTLRSNRQLKISKLKACLPLEKGL